MNFDLDLSKLPPFEECPVILSEPEYDDFVKMCQKKKRGCKHDWQYRKGREEEAFKIVKDTEILLLKLEDGKYCAECKTVRFGVAVPDDSPVWTQKDMMALGFR